MSDPGTVDPILGDFPVSESRAYQFAWVALAPAGRDFTADVRSSLEVEGVFSFKDYFEADIYLDGVYACTDLAQNVAPSSVYKEIGALYQDQEDPFDDESLSLIGQTLTEEAIRVLCPDLDILITDPDFRVPTATALRSVLGVDSSDLADADANRFANWVCEELGRGTSESRLTSQVADDRGYPDDLAGRLVDYVVVFGCG